MSYWDDIKKGIRAMGAQTRSQNLSAYGAFVQTPHGRLGGGFINHAVWNVNNKRNTYDRPEDLGQLQRMSAETVNTSPYVAGAVNDILREVVGAECKPVRVRGLSYSAYKRISDEWKAYHEGKSGDLSGRAGIEVERAFLRDIILYGDGLFVGQRGKTEHFNGWQISLAGTVSTSIGYGYYRSVINGVKVDKHNRPVEVSVVRNREYGQSTREQITFKVGADVNYIRLPNSGITDVRPWPALTSVLIPAYTLREWDKNLAFTLDAINQLPFKLTNTGSMDTDFANQGIDAGDVGAFGSDEGDIDPVRDGSLWNPEATEVLREMPTGQRVAVIPHGWDLQSMMPNGLPGQAFAQQREKILGQIAAGIGLSKSNIIKDSANSGSYSSARMDRINDEQIYNELRRWWQREYRTPLFKAWLTLNAGRFGLKPADVELLVVEWLPPKTDWIDPEKQARAMTAAMRVGLIGPIDAVEQATGRFAPEIAEQRDEYEELFGISLEQITNPNAGLESGSDEGDENGDSPEEGDDAGADDEKDDDKSE